MDFYFGGASGDIPCVYIMYQKFVLAEPCKLFDVTLSIMGMENYFISKTSQLPMYLETG